MAGDPTINVKINGDSSGLQTELGKASSGVMKAVAEMKARAQNLDLAKTLGDSEKMPTLVEGLRKMNSVMGLSTAQVAATDSGVMGLAGSLKALAPAVGLAFGVSQIVSFTREAMKAADAIEDYAKALGIPAQHLVALTASAESFGGSGDKVLGWLQKVRDFQDAIAGGGDGAKSAIEKLAGVGINGEEWAGNLPTKALEELMQKSEGAATGVGLLNDVLGRNSAAEARDHFQDLAKNGLEPVIEKYKELEEANRRLAKFHDDASGLGSGIKNWGKQVVGSVVSAPDRFMQWVLGKTPEGYTPQAEGKTAEQLESERAAAVAAELAARKAKEREEAARKVREAAQKKRQGVLDSFFGAEGQDQFRKMIEDEMGGRTTEDLQASVGEIYRALADNADMFSLQQISDMIMRYKMLVTELEKRFKRDATVQAQKDALTAKTDSELAAERKRRDNAIDGLTLALPRLSGLEAMGGILGGTGGYAQSLAELQRKAVEIADKSERAQQEIKASSERAAKALEGS